MARHNHAQPCTLIYFESAFFDVRQVVYPIQTLNTNWVENEGKISGNCHPNLTKLESMGKKPPQK